jgi:glycosyltransferase involved in cell wall biosynthesis
MSARITVVLTHPVQYFAPWFRYIASCRPEIDLDVLYVTRPRPDQQGVGFDRPFSWDVSLTDGYRCEFLNDAGGGSPSSDDFLAIDAPGIEAAIAARKPDLVLVPGWHSLSQVRALHACRRLRIPVVYRGDSHLGTGPSGWRRAPWHVRTRMLLRGGYDAWLSVGTRAREYLTHFGAPAPLVFHSPHAVDNAFFAAGADRWRSEQARLEARAALGLGPRDLAVLFAGKLAERKRPLDVLRAASELGPDVVVVVAGDGPLRRACAAEAVRLNVRLVINGFTNQSDMPRLYAVSDCLVLPSVAETWGLVVNEALAAGTPCVVSDGAGAAADLIESGSLAGEVYRGGDVPALVSAIRTVRARGSGVAVVAACRSAVAEHTFERATDGLVEAARSLAAMRRVPIAANPGAPRVLALCGGMVIVSGIERMSFEVMRVLRERGAAVHCVVNTWGSRAIVKLAEDLGASWSTGYYWHTFTRRPGPKQAWRIVWDTVMTSAGLLRDAWRFRPTHVFVPEFTTALRNAPALWLLRLCGVSVVMRLGHAPEPGRFYRFVWRGVLNRVIDRFVSNSAFIQRELLAHEVDQAKARVIRNTVPTRALQRAMTLSTHERTPGRVIFIGQVIPPKGLDLLLEAVAVLRRRGRDVTLDVVGDVDGWESPTYAGFRATVRSRAERVDLAGAVRFLGVREDVPALLQSASLHCCPSRPEQKEGFAVVNLEAKRAGLPSVVTPTGSLPEMVTHREDGWVCSDVSVAALVEGLDHFLSDPERLRRAGERARVSDRIFSRERFASAWCEEFGVPAAAMEVEAAAS